MDRHVAGHLKMKDCKEAALAETTGMRRKSNYQQVTTNACAPLCLIQEACLNGRNIIEAGLKKSLKIISKR